MGGLDRVSVLSRSRSVVPQGIFPRGRWMRFEENTREERLDELFEKRFDVLGRTADHRTTATYDDRPLQQNWMSGDCFV
jgi:hypothetical protein